MGRKPQKPIRKTRRQPRRWHPADYEGFHFDEGMGENPDWLVGGD